MVSGNQTMIAKWLIGWAVAGFVLSTVLTWIVLAVGREVIPRLTGAPPLFVIALGLMLLAWGLVNLVTTLVSAAAFAVLIVDLYETMGGGSTALGKAQQASSTEARMKTLSLSRGFVISLAVMALIASAGFSFLLLKQASIEDQVEITAHRGAAMHAPENTIAAVEAALAAATDWVEIDVQETADGEVVVLHDSDLKKVGGVDLKIWDATWEDLQEIDVGSSSHQSSATRGCRSSRRCWSSAGGEPELSSSSSTTVTRTASRRGSPRSSMDSGMASTIKVMSLNSDGLDRMKAVRPDWTTGILTSVVIGDLTRMDVDFLAVNSGMATRRFVRATHNSGKKIFAWTVNDVLGMSAMMDLGVDSIITDDPQLARDVLQYRADLNPVERLMIGLAVYFGGVKESRTTTPDPAAGSSRAEKGLGSVVERAGV